MPRPFGAIFAVLPFGVIVASGSSTDQLAGDQVTLAISAPSVT